MELLELFLEMSSHESLIMIIHNFEQQRRYLCRTYSLSNLNSIFHFHVYLVWKFLNVSRSIREICNQTNWIRSRVFYQHSDELKKATEADASTSLLAEKSP